jgi:hypothetical protein
MWAKNTNPERKEMKAMMIRMTMKWNVYSIITNEIELCQCNFPLASFWSLRYTHLTTPSPELHCPLGPFSSNLQTQLMSCHSEQHLISHSRFVSWITFYPYR